MADKDPPAVTLCDIVSEQIAHWPGLQCSERRVVVPTHCLFSGGAIVRVVVEQSGGHFTVHDGGAAIDEFSNSGASNPRATHFLKSHFRNRGILVSDEGSITCTQIEMEALAPAIAIIANASKEAEEILLSRWKPVFKRNFKVILRKMLEAEFPHLKHEVKIAGSSMKQHKFDFALTGSGGRIVLVDAVTNDANAINSTALRNLDVKQAHRADVEQRIIYDDSYEWDSSDINLLAIGAKVIPFGQAHGVLAKLAS